MNLSDQVREHVCACFCGLWVVTLEPDDAEQELRDLCRAQEWHLVTWDCDRGTSLDPTATDPLAVIKALPALAERGTTLLVMRNLHRFMGSPEVVQALDTQLFEGKQRRTFILVLAPVVDLPTELARSFVLLDHDLPDRAQLHAIASNVDPETPAPEGEALDHLLTASAGLTRQEAEGAFALSLVRHGAIQPDTVWEIKSAALKKSGLMSLHQGSECFADLGGLDALKSFCSRALRPGQRKARPRGALLLGVPGSGKSAFAKALGNECNRPTITLNLNALEGSLVGQTAERTRAALRIADAMAPCILFVDEIEKGLAGSSGQLDGGSKAGLFGTLLSWLNDHTSEVFFIATSNNISAIPAEFTRAKRFDGVFFLDFPSPEQRRAIWKVHTTAMDLRPDQIGAYPPDHDWTGAEISGCCELASLLDLPLTEAARNVVPISSTAGDTVQKLRTWSSGRCLSADRPGLYQHTTPPAKAEGGGPRRSIERLDSQWN